MRCGSRLDRVVGQKERATQRESWGKKMPANHENVRAEKEDAISTSQPTLDLTIFD